MAGVYPFRNYRVLFTPLISLNVYGSTVDVTKDVDLTDWINSLGTIKREIDNGDYDIGVFTFGDITLNAINFDRKFNGSHDAQSIFKFSRDRCKIEILFYEEDGTSSTRFKGLLNDDATREDIEKSTVRFKVLSLDSIFRQVKVPAGSIVDGDLFSTAIKKVLNVPEITSTLTYSASNVNVDLDIAIDVGEVFSNITAKSALDDLLLASNSILYVDKFDTIHVKSRIENPTATEQVFVGDEPLFVGDEPVVTTSRLFYELFGGGDLYGRENILKIKNKNNGLQRSFNSIKVNSDTVATNDAWVIEYGFRQKSVSFSFITNLDKEELIANQILSEFHVPKDEFEIDVLTKDIQTIDLLDVVKIDYSYRAAADHRDDLISIYGQAEYGINHYALTTGMTRILPKEKWKVTAIEELPKKMITRLRLRRTGKETHEGYF